MPLEETREIFFVVPDLVVRPPIPLNVRAVIPNHARNEVCFPNVGP